MTVGESYLGSVVIEAGQQPIIKLSSGTGSSERATLDDFGFASEPATAEKANLESPFSQYKSIIHQYGVLFLCYSASHRFLVSIF